MGGGENLRTMSTDGFFWDEGRGNFIHASTFTGWGDVGVLGSVNVPTPSNL